MRGEVVFELRVGEPAAGSIVIDEVPFVPATLLVFVGDAPHDHEALVLISALGSDLNG